MAEETREERLIREIDELKAKRAQIRQPINELFARAIPGLLTSGKSRDPLRDLEDIAQLDEVMEIISIVDPHVNDKALKFSEMIDLKNKNPVETYNRLTHALSLIGGAFNEHLGEFNTVKLADKTVIKTLAHNAAKNDSSIERGLDFTHILVPDTILNQL